MSLKNREDAGLDELLKATLADDLPDDVAAGMRDRIAAFRAGTAKEEKGSAASAWLFRRGLWATLAIGMLIAGFLLQGLRTRSPLADRIALIKMEISTPEPARPIDLDSESRRVVPENRPAYSPEEKEANP
jgi:hypothetical protein